MKSLLFGIVFGLLLLAPGCGSGFKDEMEEKSYLEALTNPSPSQWKRRNELQDKLGPAIGTVVEELGVGFNESIYDDLESLQIDQKLDKLRRERELKEIMATGTLKGPIAVDAKAEEAISKHIMASIWAGSIKCKVLELGKDFAKVEILDDHQPWSGFEGRRDNRIGYMTKWWDRDGKLSDKDSHQ